MKYRFTIFAFLILLLSFNLLAVFESLDTSPNVRGAGGAGVSSVFTSEAVYYNPASLTEINGIDVYSSMSNLYSLSYFTYGALTAAYPISEELGTVGIGTKYFTTELDGEEMSSEKQFTLSYGYKVMEDMHTNLSIGVGANYYHLSFGESVGGEDLGSDMAFGLDLGLLANFRNNTWIGGYVRNINVPSIGKDGEDLRQSLEIGITYMPYGNVYTSFMMKKIIEHETALHAGVSFELNDYITINIGGHNEPVSLSGGLAVNYSNLQVSYALSTHTKLDLTHQFGVGYKF